MPGSYSVVIIPKYRFGMVTRLLTIPCYATNTKHTQLAPTAQTNMGHIIMRREDFTDDAPGRLVTAPEGHLAYVPDPLPPQYST